MKKVVFIFLLFIPSILNSLGCLILLNGTSSAGKSSIAKCLQQIVKGSVILDLDELFWSNMIATGIDMKIIDKEQSYEQQYNIAKQHKKILYKELKARRTLTTRQELATLANKLAKEGKVVIVDSPMGIFKQQELSEFYNLVQDIPCYSVLVYCPFASLISHVIRRNQSGQFDQKRRMKGVLDQFLALYSCSKDVLDTIGCLSFTDLYKGLEMAQVDIARETSVEESNQIIKVFGKKYMQKFKLEDYQVVSIEARCFFDFCINTAIYRPDEAALQICKSIIV